MHRREFLLTAAATAACATIPARVGDPALELRLDDYFAPYVAARDFGGVVILARGGVVLAQRSYGAADIGRNAPNTADTRYACASVGKLFTRATIVALERAGRLSQEDTFAHFMPDYPNAENFTLLQLIQHRAGISRDLTLGADLTRRLTLEDLARRVAAMPTVGAPGERYSYSNNGYRLLGYAIEHAGGGDYGALVRELVHEPRDMQDTGEISLTNPVRGLAKGYVAGPGLGTLEPAPVIEYINHRGAGSFYSTPNDLKKFAQSLPIIPADLSRPVPANDDGSPGRRAFGHDGLGHGYANLCFKYPDDDAVLVMMSNIETGMFTPLHRNLEQFLFNETVTPPPRPPERAAPLDQERAQAYLGNYELFPGTPLIIRLQPNQLEVSAGGDTFAPLTPLGGDRFFMRQRYANLTFNVTDARAESIVWAEPGGEFTLRRLS